MMTCPAERGACVCRRADTAPSNTDQSVVRTRSSSVSPDMSVSPLVTAESGIELTDANRQETTRPVLRLFVAIVYNVSIVFLGRDGSKQISFITSPSLVCHFITAESVVVSYLSIVLQIREGASYIVGWPGVSQGILPVQNIAPSVSYNVFSRYLGTPA